MSKTKVVKFEVEPAQSCDTCHGLLLRGQYFYEASIRSYGGTWALVCEECAKKYGVMLGPGLGQKYDSQTLEKVEG